MKTRIIIKLPNHHMRNYKKRARRLNMRLTKFIACFLVAKNIIAKVKEEQPK